MKSLEKLAANIGRFFEWIGLLGFLGIFVTNFIDVVGAKVFLRPLPGATEVIEFCQVVAIAGAMANGLLQGRHIRVEFFLLKLRPGWRSTLAAFSSFLGLGLFALLAWQAFTFGTSLEASGEIGSTSHIPVYPFAYFLAASSMAMALVFFVETLRSLKEMRGNGSS